MHSEQKSRGCLRYPCSGVDTLGSRIVKQADGRMDTGSGAAPWKKPSMSKRRFAYRLDTFIEREKLKQRVNAGRDAQGV
jgi:hypothetical protein